MHCAKWKKPNRKDYLLNDYIYMTFWKRPYNQDGKQLSSCWWLLKWGRKVTTRTHRVLFYIILEWWIYDSEFAKIYRTLHYKELNLMYAILGGKKQKQKQNHQPGRWGMSTMEYRLFQMKVTVFPIYNITTLKGKWGKTDLIN